MFEQANEGKRYIRQNTTKNKTQSYDMLPRALFF